jgi:hypothetical protein
VSPIVFLIYITNLHKTIEKVKENILGLFFVGSVTWVVTGGNIDEVTDKLERFIARILQ